jgi:hypothetical protein
MTIDGEGLEVETPSGEEVTGTPPEDDAAGAPAGEPTPPESDLDEPPVPEEPEESESWQALQRKFPGKTDAELRALVGDQFWEAKNYASRLARENEELRAAAEPTEPEEEEPHPQVEALDKRIHSLYDKDQASAKQQQQSLISLAEADKQIAKTETKLEMVGDDEYAKGTLEAQLETANIKRTSILQRLHDLKDKREGFTFDMERLLADKDWLTKVAKQSQANQKKERESLSTFNDEFPDYVDELIADAADGLKVTQDAKIRQSLWKSVNRALMVDLQSMRDEGMADVDIPEMVSAYVKEYVEDRDLAARTRFEQTSEEKRRVAGKTTPTPVPTAKKPPIHPSLMATGNQTPAMLKARKYLASRNL